MTSTYHNELNKTIDFHHRPKVKLKFKCGFCGKKYLRHSLFERHYNSCKTKDSLKKQRKPPVQNEKEIVNVLSLNRKLNRVLDILYIQSERIKHMEKMLEAKNPTIRNKLKWLIEHVVPSDTFQDCLSKITLKRDHYNYITKHGYLKGYCDLVEEAIDDYKETIYSFTTSNMTYVYVNKKEGWVEFNKKHAFALYCRIQQQLLNVALTVEDIPDRILLMNNAIIYGTNAQSIDIKTKIKTTVCKKTVVGIETLLNRYETTETD